MKAAVGKHTPKSCFFTISEEKAQHFPLAIKKQGTQHATDVHD